ncbi:hypothetical protein TIFTF001_045849 [Ficus carica]|uniref:Retrotransposon gag domain-containing protein n=1 Tax=Ficus carica TaxID=3494 RepID=A0AA87ZDM3_FICCA|nr:hypothetical protein TIFTF001_045849 [Ficus carica]
MEQTESDKKKGRPSVRLKPLQGPGRRRQYTPLITTTEHILNHISGKGLLRDPPPIRIDCARRNRNKYCNFHKDVGHETKDCIQLWDQIELLVQDGHLGEFVEKIITPISTANRTDQARPYLAPGPSDQTNAQKKLKQVLQLPQGRRP